MSDVLDPDDAYERDLGEGGINPPDRSRGVEEYGTTADEQAAPVPLGDFVKREEPERAHPRPEPDPAVAAEEDALHTEEL